MIRLVTLLLLLLLGGCAGAHSPLYPAGDHARSMDFLFALMTWICGGMYVLIIGFLGATIWRGRVGAARDAAPAVEPADKGLHRNLLFWGVAIVIALTVLIIASFLVAP
jgi:heme/copper-type cytochrome/quinol oxidase subunit 2